MMKDLEFEFDSEKDEWLRKERHISFEEIIICILEDAGVKITPHHNQKKYPYQVVYQVEIDNYIWLVPAEKRKDVIRLITAYPSRKATRGNK